MADGVDLVAGEGIWEFGESQCRKSWSRNLSVHTCAGKIQLS